MMHLGRSCVSMERSMRGFSLVELMITIVVAGILASIALPSFREMGVRMTVTTNNNDLVTAINTARAEAVKRGMPVAVVSTSGGSDWSSGWSLWADTARNGSFTGLKLTTVHLAVPDHYSVKTKASGVGGVDDKIAFDALGALNLGTMFDLNVCRADFSPDATQSRRIHVAGSGEVSSYRDVTGSPAGTCG